MKIESAGIRPGKSVAEEAISAMRQYDLDISDHEPRSVADFDIHAFDYVVALSKEVRRDLLGHHPDAKIAKMYVDDPFGSDLGRYMKCAQEIAQGLRKLASLKKAN